MDRFGGGESSILCLPPQHILYSPPAVCSHSVPFLQVQPVNKALLLSSHFSTKAFVACTICTKLLFLYKSIYHLISQNISVCEESDCPGGKEPGTNKSSVLSPWGHWGCLEVLVSDPPPPPPRLLHVGFFIAARKGLQGWGCPRQKTRVPAHGVLLLSEEASFCATLWPLPGHCPDWHQGNHPHPHFQHQ